MPAYDSIQFEPPAPLANVTLRNPNTQSTWSNVPMLIDSGADVTLVPQDVLTRLGLAVNSKTRYELAGFDGNRSLASVVRLELVFCRRTFRGQFLIIDQPWGILGRNILNAVPLLLDGPGLTWDEKQIG